MYGYNQDGRKSLENFKDRYIEWYDGKRRINRLNAYNKKQGSASIYDCMDMLESLLILHQSKFYINNDYPWILTFPYLFVQPSVGDVLINMTTREEYVIQGVEELSVYERRWTDIPKQSTRKKSSFSGRIVLEEGISPPDRYTKLQFKDISKNYVNFFEWGSRRAATKPYNSNADASEQQEGPFKPTLTWNVVRVEPASLGAHPFDPAKQLKPQIRETFPDPDHTYQIPNSQQNLAASASYNYPITTGWGVGTGTIYTGATSYRILSETEQSPSLSTHTITVYGQRFDNIVQFDCWSDNNYEASSLVAWFEDFMDLYTRILKINGVSEILYWQRSVDQKIERWRNDIDNRTIQYYIRTETIRAERDANLNKLDIRIVVSRTADSALLYGEPQGINTQTGMYGFGHTGINYNIGSGLFYTGDYSYNWGRLVIME